MSVELLLHQSGILLLGGLMLMACGREAGDRSTGLEEPEIVVQGDPLIRGAEEGDIPALRDPLMVPAAEAESFMLDHEPVVGVAPPGETPRAYSTWHLDSHEIVNDKLRSGPLLVTW